MAARSPGRSATPLTNAALASAITVQAFLPNGTLVKTIGINADRDFVISLPAGTYLARTVVSNAGAYLDELFNEQALHPELRRDHRRR